jgi:MFS family permease
VLKNPKAILALLTALNLLNYLDRYVLSAVLKPIQVDLAVSGFAAGTLATVFLVGYFTTSPLFGHWADRSARARKWLVVFGVVVWSLATIATGLARGFWSLLAARAVVGVGEASYVTIAPTIIDDIAPAKARARWLSIFFTAIPVGSALGYLIGGAVQRATHDWRQAFYVAGVPGLGLGLLCLLISDRGEARLDAPPESPTGGGWFAKLRRAARAFWGSARSLTSLPLYRDVVFGQCAFTAAINGFGYWAPKYVADRYHLDPGYASIVFGGVLVAGGAIGTLLGGALGDRATRGREDDASVARGNLAVCAIATWVGAALTAAALSARTSTAFFAIALPCEVALFVQGGPFNVAVFRSVPSHLRSSAMALSIFAMHLLGDLWSPPLIGLIADFAPMAWAMLLCPAGFAVAGSFWWRGWRVTR